MSGNSVQPFSDLKGAVMALIKTALACVVAWLSVALMPTAHAADYPTKPIELVLRSPVR